jgi:TusA-related sulfurtransferase
MNIDEILEVFADDPVAEEDIKSWIKKSENELLSFNKDDKLLKFLIRKVK